MKKTLTKPRRKMFESIHQLLRFFDVAEKIHGRKKLQKVIHLLQSEGAAFPFPYRYHHYGPYSPQLQAEMNQLVEQGYLEEDAKEGAYEYTITDKGREFKTLLEDDGNFSFQFNEGLMNDLVGEDTQSLEILSTYIFLLEMGDSKDVAKEKAKQLKPHLTDRLDAIAEKYADQITN